MKKTLLVTALLLAAVSPAMAARKQAPAQMPLTLKPLTTQKAITVSGEYIMFENNTNDESGYGIALRYDKAFAPLMENHYWSWNVGGFWNTGKIDAGNPGGEADEFTLIGARLGLDANFVIAPRTTIFMGPRVGYATYKEIVKVAGNQDVEDHDDSFTYGFNVGVRYLMPNGKWALEGGFSHTWYAQRQAGREQGVGSKESNTFYGGMSFSF